MKNYILCVLFVVLMACRGTSQTNVHFEWYADSLVQNVEFQATIPGSLSNTVLFTINGNTVGIDAISIVASVGGIQSTLNISSFIDTIVVEPPPPPPPPPPSGNALADSFFAMVSGDWIEFPTNNLDDVQNSGGESYTSIFDWAEGPAWDAISERAYMVGGGHGGAAKFIQYDAETNTWSDNWILPFDPSPNALHQTDESAVMGGVFYHKRSNLFGGSAEYIYRWGGSDWAEINHSLDLSCCGAIFEFPGLGFVIAAGSIHVSNDGFQTFGSSLGNIIGSYNFAAEYSPVQNRAVFMGGENNRRSVQILDQQGNLNIGTNAPVDVYVASSCLTYDPVNGLFMLMSSDLYSYDAINDVWELVLTRAEIPMQRINPNNNQPISNGWRVNAFPAYTGIVWLFSDNWSLRGNMWLYKP